MFLSEVVVSFTKFILQLQKASDSIHHMTFQHTQTLGFNTLTSFIFHVAFSVVLYKDICNSYIALKSRLVMCLSLFYLPFIVGDRCCTLPGQMWIRQHSDHRYSLQNYCRSHTDGCGVCRGWTIARTREYRVGQDCLFHY